MNLLKSLLDSLACGLGEGEFDIKEVAERLKPFGFIIDEDPIDEDPENLPTLTEIFDKASDLLFEAGKVLMQYADGLDDKGELLGYRGADSNITERKKAEEAPLLTQFSIDRVSDAAFWLDINGNFFYVNESACRSFGYTKDEFWQLSNWSVFDKIFRPMMNCVTTFLVPGNHDRYIFDPDLLGVLKEPYDEFIKSVIFHLTKLNL